MTDDRISRFRAADEDSRQVHGLPDAASGHPASARLAYADLAFLTRDELRGVRLQLELEKAELELQARGIQSTVVIFGSARIPAPDAASDAAPGLAALSGAYAQARDFARAITERSLRGGGRDWVVVTGGGPGIMEAGNRGAAEAGGLSIGLNIVLPHEQHANPWVTPDLTFTFHYFAIRKMHFLMRARAIAVFPGGFGTLDEMFEALTLVQTGKSRKRPILLFGRDFWYRLIDFDYLVATGMVSPGDLGLFHFVETAEEAWEVLDAEYGFELRENGKELPPVDV